MKNRMRELRSFGSVRGEGRKVLAYSEILGFLMYLEDLGRVEKRVGPARDSYRLVPERVGLSSTRPVLCPVDPDASVRAAGTSP